MNELRSGARLRADAAKAIDAVVSDGRSLDAVLADTAEYVSADDMPLVKMLCYGVLRHHWRLREQLRALLDKPLKSARQRHRIVAGDRYFSTQRHAYTGLRCGVDDG